MSNPPPGWYDDPAGRGRRYWDGTTWTDQYQQGASEHRERPNDDAWGLAFLFGLLSYVGLLAVLNPRIGGTTAYGAGRLLVPAAVASGLVGLVARASSRRLGWWVYLLAVPVVATAIAVATTAGDLH